MLLIVAVTLIGATGGFFGVTYALKHVGGGKSKANPAAQVSAPSADAAVHALSILTKVHGAYTNVTSVRADGTVTLFLDLSNITVADVNPNQSANAKNAARHPPGMPRIVTNTTELSIKRAQTNLYYMAMEAVSKVDRMTMTNTFAFWKSDKGQFMFTDSHQKMIPPSYRQMTDSNSTNSQPEQIKKIQEMFADPANLTKIIKDLGQTEDESVNGQDCYTLTAKVLGQKVKVWVGKTTYLIPQWQITLGGQISDADIDDAFSLYESAFTNMPPPALEMIKTQVKKFAPVMMKIRGTITSTSRNVEVNPTLAADDFNYDVPPGVRLVRMPAATSRGNQLEINQRNACINNLRQIDAAKQQWALENGKKSTDTPAEDDIKPYVGKPDANGNQSFPKCPAGGKYTIGRMDQMPTCSVPGHVLSQ